MYYGNDVLVLEEGLRIRPKALRPIGIKDGSKCWGVEIVSTSNQGKPPHLLVSAFPPDKWHILFHVIVELKDESGTLARAATIIGEAGFNILSTHCAPSGHTHATWNVIAEAESRKSIIDKTLEECIESFDPTCSAFDKPNDLFRKELTEKFSVPLLRHSKFIEDILDKANENLEEKQQFLHKRFVQGNTLLYTNELQQFFDNHSEKDKELFNRIKEHELYRAVESRWLQQMAVFRCYSQAAQKMKDEKNLRASWDNPIPFKYDAKNSLLKPETPDEMERYLQIVGNCASAEDLPIRAIAAFNSEEHYLRLVLPEQTNRTKRIWIELDYRVNLDGISQQSSKGLLKDVAEIIVKHQVSMNYISNATTTMTRLKERGVLSLIGTVEGNEKKNNVIKKLRAELENIDDKNKNLRFEKATVGVIGAKRIFISTKLKLFKQRDTIKDDIERLCRRRGFIPVWGDPQADPTITGENPNDLSENIKRRIGNSHAFLQVIPKDAKKQEWLHFELGIAYGLELPVAICVDEEKVREYPLQVADNWSKFPFNGESDTPRIIESIDVAVTNLAIQVYGR